MLQIDDVRWDRTMVVAAPLSAFALFRYPDGEKHFRPAPEAWDLIAAEITRRQNAYETAKAKRRVAFHEGAVVPGSRENLNMNLMLRLAKGGSAKHQDMLNDLMHGPTSPTLRNAPADSVFVYGKQERCTVCGIEMVVSAYAHHSVTTCSDRCEAERVRAAEKATRERKAAWAREHRRSRAKAPQSRACGQCGEAFTPKRSDARYCSARCRVAAHRAG